LSPNDPNIVDPGPMDVRVHSDVAEFAAIAGALYRRDPVLSTVELSVLEDPAALRRICAESLLLLTVWQSGDPVGAAMQTLPFPLLCTGLRTADQVDAAVDALAQIRPDLNGVRGTRATATLFAVRWTAVTGRAATVTTEERLYRLDTLIPPVGVAGGQRMANPTDAPLLDRWWTEFRIDVFGTTVYGPPADDPVMMWEVDATPSSMAMVRRPAAGVSRIGPVYTPPNRRGHGYGSAVTAAAAQWAQGHGASEVVLFTDLSNPVSNGIYRRIGFRPVADSARLDFGPAARG
jgi:GNAT superfamily N-acetyltransferase